MKGRGKSAQTSSIDASSIRHNSHGYIRAPNAFLQELSQAIAARVQPMSQQSVSEAGKAFLKSAADVLLGVGKEVAMASCSSAQQVTTLEGELRSAIGAWKHMEDGTGMLQELPRKDLNSKSTQPSASFTGS